MPKVNDDYPNQDQVSDKELKERAIANYKAPKAETTKTEPANSLLVALIIPSIVLWPVPYRLSK